MNSQVQFSDISRRLLLRFGSRYVDFWKNEQGRIFDLSSPTINMKNCAYFASAQTIKKDQLAKPYQLIDLANIEPQTGFPIGLDENIVDEIGSDKVFLDDADLIFSKLNSHIGYVFLRNEIPNNGYELIGSTEFYPLKVDSTKILPKLLKYFLLHKTFREKAVFLRSGKSQSHPRIQVDDFFNLKIPRLDKDLQKYLVIQIEAIESQILNKKSKFEETKFIIDDVFTKNGSSTIPQLKNNESYSLFTDLSNISKTKWLSCRPFLIRFIEQELPNYLEINLKRRYIDFTRFIKYLASGEYIPQKSYSEIETNFVYLKIGNVSRNEFNFEEITYLVDEIGKQYEKIELQENDLIITRSGTVGKCVIFKTILLPSKKVIPSHHLAIIRLNSLSDTLFLKYYIQSSFGSDFLWAFSTGKVQKEITNWSIKKIPIPDIKTRDKIVSEIQERETNSQILRSEIKHLRSRIDELITTALDNPDQYAG